jgi:hypothetical protein
MMKLSVYPCAALRSRLIRLALPDARSGIKVRNLTFRAAITGKNWQCRYEIILDIEFLKGLFVFILLKYITNIVMALKLIDFDGSCLAFLSEINPEKVHDFINGHQY